MSELALLDTERILYAVVSGVGLLITVWVMLHGSVRTGHTPGTLRPPPAGFNTPVIGAALLAFGAAGYLVAKYSQLGTIWTVAIALIAGASGWVGMTVLMAKWALRGPLSDPHEELEELQGTIAVVTRPITTSALGQISYNFRGTPTTAQARSIDGQPVTAGTEVVIDMISDGIASVELWSVVETRL